MSGAADLEVKQGKQTFESPISTTSLVREACLGYAFWSLFHGLAPMIWFYPLNELEISGYEAFCLIWLCPILTGIKPFFKLVQSRWTLGLLRICVAASLGSFQAPSTLMRLAALSLGNGAAVMVLTATLWSKSGQQRCLTYWGLMLGYFLMLVSRIFFTSFCPTWWNDVTNSAIIAIVSMATIGKIISGEDGSPQEIIETPTSGRPNWLLTSVLFGSVLFLTHWVYGEVSILTRWTVTGYPHTGPLPYPWGLCVLAVLVAGACLSLKSARTNIVTWVFGAQSFFQLYYCADSPWLAFIGGLLGGVYLMVIWPEVVDQVMSCPPGRTMSMSLLVYILEILFCVWTTAFNFVPGGEYTREHSDFLLVFILITIALGLYTRDEKSSKRICMSPNYIGTGINIRWFLISLLVLGGAGFGTRYFSNNIHPPIKADPTQFRAAIWTFHFGYDNQGWPSMERAAKMMEDTDADVFTLLESDASKPFLGNNDLAMWLGERLGMYVDFGPSTKDHTWGNLILSKYPIVNSTHHLLPSPHGELAPAITATVNMSGRLVDFVVTHMGNDRDVYDRELQAKYLSWELRNRENPTVFLGYVTSAPGSRDYKQFVEEGAMKDIDETDMDRWCEYIMYKKLIRLGYARISHGSLSDTELQMAAFQIPGDPMNYEDNNRMTTDPSDVAEQTHFNKRFGNLYAGHNWALVHKFHMGTPKYFIP